MIPKDSAPVVIASPLGITLRHLEPAHAFALLATIAPHQAWLPQFPLAPLSIDDVEEFCQYSHHSSTLGHGLMAGIWRDDVLIGHAGVHSRDLTLQTGEFSCWIAPHAQRQGLAHSAAEIALQHAFTTLGLERIDALAAPHNQRAERFLSRLGFKAGDSLNHRRSDGSSLVCRNYHLNKASAD